MHYEMLQCAFNDTSNKSNVLQLHIAVTKCACLVLNSAEKYYHNFILCGKFLP